MGTSVVDKYVQFGWEITNRSPIAHPILFGGYLRVVEFITGGTVVVELDEYELECSITKDAQLYYNPDFEADVVSTLQSLLEPNSVFVDVGSSIGYYTLRAASVVDDQNIWAFDPNETRFELLQGNLERNCLTGVTTRNIRLGDGDDYPGLTDVVDEIPDVVKLDVEGDELRVLRGMDTMLSADTVSIVCEVHPAELDSRGQSTEELAQFLSSHAYEAAKVTADGLISVDAFDSDINHYVFSPET